ncbi:MAG TPA: UbiA family prenyltransferase [Candidatus Limnocylindria bacterium]|nr:UbiA family prenyltransferase [Candidatus Limnocylindria bacterium]
MRFGSSLAARLSAAARLIHLAPSVAVTALSGALGGVLLSQAGEGIGERWWLTVAAVAGSQVFVGSTNDIVDRGRDIDAGRPDKPLAAGELSLNGALWVASIGLAVQLAASLRLGQVPLLLGLAAVASALAYNLWLSRTPFSVLPYLISFGLLPLWVASGVGIPLERVALTPLLVAPFAAAGHLANAVRDFEADAVSGSRNLAQVLGRQVAFFLAWGLAMAVGGGVGVAFAIGGRLDPLGAALGLAGMVAVAQGIGGPVRLWGGLLVAAVLWTAAWAIGSG